MLTVSTGIWSLAQLAQIIGQGNVKVTDVVPQGQDPLTWTGSPGVARRIRSSDFTLAVSGKLQPGFTAAAKGSRHLLTLGSPYFWLNPHSMYAPAKELEKAMIAADPKAESTFSNGYANLDADLSSLDAEFGSDLSACPERTLVTAGNAFSTMVGRYQLKELDVMGTLKSPLPTGAEIKAQIARIRSAHTSEIYIQSWVPTSSIIVAAVSAGVKRGQLETLVGPPTAGYPEPKGNGSPPYVLQMDRVLNQVIGALHCGSENDGSD